MILIKLVKQEQRPGSNMQMRHVHITNRATVSKSLAKIVKLKEKGLLKLVWEMLCKHSLKGFNKLDG